MIKILKNLRMILHQYLGEKGEEMSTFHHLHAIKGIILHFSYISNPYEYNIHKDWKCKKIEEC